MEIKIRPLVVGDAAAMFEAVRESVPEVGRFLSWCHSDYSMADAQEWTQSAATVRKDGLDYRFVIEDCNTGTFLGSVAINQIDHANGVGNLGYWVRSSVTGQGVCSRAARLAVEFAFAELALTRVEIYALVDNVASNAVATRIGATYEGVLRNRIKLHGSVWPAHSYSIIPADYLEGQVQ